jgi:DNA transformation protein and related proteins
MDAEGLKALFEPFGPVSVKRMFGGHGVYSDGLCFAVESGGEVYLKADAEAEKNYAEAGSTPFIFVARGKPMTTSYWRLVASAYDDPDELRRWSALAVGAARRAAAAKAKPARAKGSKEKRTPNGKAAVGRGPR